jgi:serine/threonine-protein kinase HipA
MTRKLDVFLGRDKVGMLEQDRHGALWFAYDGAWLENEHAVPVSASLPLRAKRYQSRDCRPFFSGLLPEELSRQRVAERFGVSERNDFALLEKIGAECAGAVSLLPPGELPQTGLARYRKLDVTELEGKLRSLPQSPLLVGEEGIRLSLAGAQGKAVLAMRGADFLLPMDGSPSTHILKPASGSFPDLVENEFFCMRLADALGIKVARVELGEAGAIRFLQITRYDRQEADDGSWERIHQEDFCQALGIAPELKYQEEGGPGLNDCFDLVRQRCDAPAPDVLRLFDAVVLNFLIGNNDAHGKNFSLIHEEGQTRLAPLYDLVSTEQYPELSANMAMRIGRTKNANEVTSKDWRALFQGAGLGPAMAIRRMHKMANDARLRSSQLIKAAPMASGVMQIISRRAAAILALRVGN